MKKIGVRYLTKKFKNLTRKEIAYLLESEVLNSPDFNEHVKEVSFKTKIDEEIIKDILKSYFTNILVVINTVRKVKTKINVYGHFFIIIEKGTHFKK